MVIETAPLDFDVVILGGGSAGYAAARTTAAGGLKTLVLEGGREVGGLCILRGCMPSKALLHAAEVLHLARKGGIWGLDVAKASFDWSRVMARKDALIREFADYRRGQLSDGRFAFMRSNARFLDARSVRLDNGQTVTGRHFVISTGSVAAPAPWPDLDRVGYWTSDDVLAAKSLPHSIIVLGGGAVAVELAQVMARFDCEVTLIQRSPHLIRDFDFDAADSLAEALRNDGIRVYTDTKVLDVSQSEGRKAITFLHQGAPVRVEAEEFLHAMGRSPNVAGLGLEKAGVALTEGRIQVDEGMRTTAPNIFAAGDCAGPYQIVHLAVQQGEIAAHNILNPRHPRRMEYRLLINVVFTDPQIASVGLTEAAAKQAGVRHLAASYAFNDHGKSLIMDATVGFVKLLADPLSGEILGGAVAGPSGGELIHEIVVAMAKRMTVRELAAMPHYHPTLAEIWSYPAEELADKIPMASS